MVVVVVAGFLVHGGEERVQIRNCSPLVCAVFLQAELHHLVADPLRRSVVVGGILQQPQCCELGVHATAASTASAATTIAAIAAIAAAAAAAAAASTATAVSATVSREPLGEAA